VEPGSEAVTHPPWDALLYCDSSALARAYLPDEAGHDELSARLLDPRRLTVTSALTEGEMVVAIGGAARAGRLRTPAATIADVVADLGADGPIMLIDLEPRRVLPRARELCADHRLRTLDAIHLAVALNERDDLAGEAELVFVTRDEDQAAAARAEGLPVA
jgi:predicted nucleic acid-binding protein